MEGGLLGGGVSVAVGLFVVGWGRGVLLVLVVGDGDLGGGYLGVGVGCFGRGVFSGSGADGGGDGFGWGGDVEGFFHWVEVDVADDGGAEEEDDFEAFGVFHLDAGVVRFVDGDFFEMFEEGDGDVGFFVFLLGAIGVSGFAGEIADQIFGQLSFFLPFEVDLGGGV